ncbi:MAG: hypothetical protein AVDCRST_MAG54-1828, partial [uncultured Actinomycetospora sp.]
GDEEQAAPRRRAGRHRAGVRRGCGPGRVAVERRRHGRGRLDHGGQLDHHADRPRDRALPRGDDDGHRHRQQPERLPGDGRLDLAGQLERDAGQLPRRLGHDRRPDQPRRRDRPARDAHVHAHREDDRGPEQQLSEPDLRPAAHREPGFGSGL